MATNFYETSATMNDLPNELLTLIFEHLHIMDLIRCSSVCKRFKSLCQNVRIPELIISNRSDNINDYWFYTNKHLNLQHAINVTTFNSYRSIFRLDKFRRLYFEGSYSEFVQLKVNDLTKLEQLKIHVATEVDVEHVIHIDLPNLKIVDVDAWSQKFYITTPKLEMVKCTNFDIIHVTDPSTIKHVETDSLSDRLHALNNLQYLHVVQLGEIDLTNYLSSFPKLTTFSCTGHRGWVPSGIRSLVEYKRTHRLTQPKIYFISVEVDDIGKIDDFDRHRDELLFQISNYGSLAETVFRHYPIYLAVRYSQLMDLLNGRMPDDFFKKYFNIRSVWVEKPVASQEHLFGFLKSFNYLSKLNIRNDSLDQSHLNRLGELHQLTALALGTNSRSMDSDEGEKSTVNFDFLLQMPLLQYFYATINSFSLFDLTLKLFTQLKYFEAITFYHEGNFVWITKNLPANEYKVSYKYRYVIDKLDFNGLVREIDRIKKLP